MSQELKPQQLKENSPEPKSTELKERLKLRLADRSDVPTIQSLLDDFAALYLEDVDELLDAQGVLDSGYTVMIDHYGFPVGGFWLSDIVPGLHGTVSLLLRPKYLKQAFRDEVFGEFLTKAFAVLNLKKIKARALKRQSGAMKLLKRYRFFNLCKLWNETWVDGKPEDIYLFELQHKYWSNNRQEIINGKHRKKRKHAEHEPEPPEPTGHAGESKSNSGGRG